MLLNVDLYFLTNRGTIIFQINAQGNYHYYSFLKLRISLSSKRSIDNASPHDFIELAMVIIAVSLQYVRIHSTTSSLATGFTFTSTLISSSH